MAFREKYRRLCDWDPDVLVIQECENPAQKGEWDEFTDWKWIGDNQNKGLGIFTRGGYTLNAVDTNDTSARYVLPVQVQQGLKLLGVWAMNDEMNPEQRYIGQVYTALRDYEFIDSNTIIAGDWNWNVIWDESPKSALTGDFEDVTEILGQHSLESAYHSHFDQDFGEESDPTFYMHKKKERPYHIDYLFTSEQAGEAIEVTVGEYEDWHDKSDHMPMLVDIEL